MTGSNDHWTMPGPDGLLRCPWALSATEYLAYHDNEWGRPVTSVQGLYERMTLEAFQSGLGLGDWVAPCRDDLVALSNGAATDCL